MFANGAKLSDVMNILTRRNPLFFLVVVIHSLSFQCWLKQENRLIIFMATSTVIDEQMIIDQTNSSTYTNINKDDSCNLIGSSSSLQHLEFLHQQQQTSNDDKLPLKQPWSTYFYKADKQRDWKQNVIYITSIHYVEDFWSFYTHTYGLRDLTNGTDYMMFKVLISLRISSINFPFFSRFSSVVFQCE